MERSWFATTFPPPRKRRDSNSLPVSATMIPPPIAQSIYMTPPTGSPAGSHKHLPTPQRPWYYRKQRGLEVDLQVLLDAQAEGLTEGLDAAPPTTSEESTTDPLSSRISTISLSIGEHENLRNGHITLRAARKGLYTTMRRLAVLKAEEAAEVANIGDGTSAELQRVNAWAVRQAKLKARAEEISKGPNATRAQQLQAQAASLQPQIDELETRIAEVKNRQRQLLKQAEDIDNGLQAKISSYHRSLDSLHRDVTSYLRDMQPGDSVAVFDTNGTDRGEDVFWRLPTKRRTLELATEVLSREKAKIDQKAEGVDTEREALEEGAIVWKDVVREVEAFERDLRQAMSPSQQQEDDPGANLTDLWDRMDQVAEQLESQSRLAETRDWKLLIAAIGAEVDAFQKARSMLGEVLGITQESELPDGHAEENGNDNTGSVIHAPPVPNPSGGSASGDKMDELDHVFHDRRTNDSQYHDDDDDDDGPDPELMISR